MDGHLTFFVVVPHHRILDHVSRRERHTLLLAMAATNFGVDSGDTRNTTCRTAIGYSSATVTSCRSCGCSTTIGCYCCCGNSSSVAMELALLLLQGALAFVVGADLVATHAAHQPLPLAEGQGLQQALVYLHVLGAEHVT